MKYEIPESNPGREHIYPFKSNIAEVASVWAIILVLSLNSFSLVVLFGTIKSVAVTLRLPEELVFAAVVGIVGIIGLIFSLMHRQKNAYIRLFGKTLTVVSKSGKEQDYYIPDFKEFDRIHGYFLVFEQDGKEVKVSVRNLSEENRSKLVNDIKVVLEKGDLPFEPGAQQTPEDLRLEEKKERMERRKRAEQMGVSLEALKKEEEGRFVDILMKLNHTDRMIVQRFLERGDKVNAIKTIREVSGAGLKDCKTASEMFFEVFKPDDQIS